MLSPGLALRAFSGTALLLLLALGGCARCPPGQEPGILAEAFFGRSIPGEGRVGDAEWAAFVDEVVSPAFPQGLTVQDAAGQWRDASGAILREDAKRLSVLLPQASGAEAADRLRAVAEAYLRRFRQESVLRVQHRVCTSF